MGRGVCRLFGIGSYTVAQSVDVPILPEFTEFVMAQPKVSPQVPADIAREAIRKLAARRLPPTPDNFREAYAEVAGLPQPIQSPQAKVPGTAEPESGEPAWPDLVRLLVKQWDAHQTGLSQARKREMLERVLINFGHDGRLLHDKLEALTRTWAAGVPDELDRPAAESAGEAAPAPAAVTSTAEAAATGVRSPDLPQDPGTGYRALLQTLADNLRLLADTCDARWPELAGRASDLARGLAGAGHLDAGQYERWSALWRELLCHLEDDHEISAGLRRLMGLLFLNIGELVGDEAWLSGQFTAMENLMAGEVQLDALLEAERGLRELAFRQGVLKGSLDEARDQLRTLINTFIDRVGEMSRSADGYHVRMGEYSERIGQVRDLSELGDLMGLLTTDVGELRDALRHNHAELVEARGQAEQAEQRIQELEQELAQVSNLVREDQLTGALNRRGMDEAFGRELARADRLGAPLCIGMLDIDHFKKLNDSLGHQAGDEALRHLTRVVRELLRPTDTLARYGGEEFLIMLPNTQAEEGRHILERIQRALTRQIFLHDNERVLITFSAGVAERRAEEEAGALVARADAAMYQAKSRGRNRVELA